MYKRLLVPVDTSYPDYGWLSSPLASAVDLVKQTGGSLHLVSVVPDNLFKGYYPNVYSEEVVATSRKRLEEIRNSMVPGDVQVQIHVVEGGICSQVLRIAREIRADLIVMSSHGPLVRDYLLGSNAAHIALHAPCSVFVVRNGQSK